MAITYEVKRVGTMNDGHLFAVVEHGGQFAAVHPEGVICGPAYDNIEKAQTAMGAILIARRDAKLSRETARVCDDGSLRCLAHGVDVTRGVCGLCAPALARPEPPRTLTGNEQLCNECATVFDADELIVEDLADHELSMCAACIHAARDEDAGHRDGLVAERECEGHPAGPFDAMGETAFCDGSCIEQARSRRDPGDVCDDCGGYRAYVGHGDYRCMGCGGSR